MTKTPATPSREPARPGEKCPDNPQGQRKAAAHGSPESPQQSEAITPKFARVFPKSFSFRGRSRTGGAQVRSAQTYAATPEMEIPGAMGGSQGAWSHILHRVSKGGSPSTKKARFRWASWRPRPCAERSRIRDKILGPHPKKPSCHGRRGDPKRSMSARDRQFSTHAHSPSAPHDRGALAAFRAESTHHFARVPRGLGASDRRSSGRSKAASVRIRSVCPIRAVP